MIRILIICLLIALCNTCQIDRTALKKLKNDISVAKDFLHDEVDSNDAIVFFGNAKSGKSTLVNYLIPTELFAKRTDMEKSMKILQKDRNPTGPEIVAGSESGTTIPTKWSSKTFSKFSLWDLPGFQDNRGPEQDIVNRIYIKQLLMNVKNPRIVLVVDHGTVEFNEYFTSFRSLLESVKAFFKGNFKKIFSSIAVIFTKVDHKQDSHYIIELKEMLNEASKNEIDEDIKEFVRDLASTNSNRIGLFKVPEHEGTVGEECNININDAINSCQGISNDILQSVSLKLSAGSSQCMYETLTGVLLNPYYSYIFKLGEQIELELKQLREKLQTLELEEKIEPALMRKLTLIVCAKEEQDFEKKFSYLKNISVPLKQKIENYELQSDYNLISFLDGLLKSNGQNEIIVANELMIVSLEAALESEIMKERLRKSKDALDKMKETIYKEHIEGEKRVKNKMYELVDTLKKVKGVDTFKDKLLYLVAAVIGAFALIFFTAF